jgi:hypothetical protein
MIPLNDHPPATFSSQPLLPWKIVGEYTPQIFQRLGDVEVGRAPSGSWRYHWLLGTA